MGRPGVEAARAMLLTLLLLAPLLPCVISVNANSGLISGRREPCSNEGEKVTVATIADTKCFTCRCKNGFVECHPGKCPNTDGCHLLIAKKTNECCHRCKGCNYRGKHYESHSEFADPADPCRVMRCEAGVITESNLQCYAPCKNPQPPAPGKCCMTCPGCRINGQTVTQNRDVTIPEDPCVKCHCDGGSMTCVKKACPVLQCPIIRQLRLPGECCPRCTGTRYLMPIENKCFFSYQVLDHEVKFDKDKCTHCVCLNETTICKRNTCPVLECDLELQKTKPGACCPHCPPVEEIKTTCSFGGKTYEDGESWQLDPCKSCMCNRGESRCAMQRCQIRSNSCAPGFKAIKRPGQCCTECVENDGVCTVFGDPHYKTFDGKFFSFQGSCKYQLTADCSGKTFSVRVTNDARNTRHSAWTRTVSLRAGDLRVNLGQRLRVKVNGTRIELPFILDGTVRIERRNESVMVTTQNGVGLLWDGSGLLEVSVSAAYKGKLCGLCGNYNSVAQDDLTTKRGKSLTDPEVWKFANSWRVGGKRACGRQNENPYKKPQCKPKNGKNPCRYLKDDSQFGGCDSKLNPHNYYEACLQDMCECPKGGCHCESLSAYAHECTRLGVLLPDWRKDTRCRPGGGGGRGGGRRKSTAKPYSYLQQPLGSIEHAHRIPYDVVHTRRRNGSPPSKLPIK